MSLERSEKDGDRGEKSECRQPNCYVSTSCVSKGAAAGWWKQNRFPQPDWASTLSLSLLSCSCIIQVTEGNNKWKGKKKLQHTQTIVITSYGFHSLLLATNPINAYVSTLTLGFQNYISKSSKYISVRQSRRPNPLSATSVTFVMKQ